MKTILIVLIIFSLDVFAVDKYNNPLLDSLSSSFFEERGHGKILEELIDSISDIENPLKNKALYDFAIKSKRYREYIIESFIINKDDNAFRLLSEYKDSLYDTQWRSIGGVLKRNPWKLNEFHSVFFQVLNKSKDEEVRNEICEYFNKNALYEDLEKLRIHLNVEPNSFARMSIFSAHARYSDSITNATIIKWFNEFDEPRQLSYLIGNGIWYSNRHDLIPELQNLKASLAAIKDVKKIDDAKMLINTIDRTLPKLNKNKPAGKPLDWGHDY